MISNYMAFYDSYNNLSDRITPMGRVLVGARVDSMLKAVKKHLDLKNADVLEVGPGKGYISRVLRKNGANVHLIEPGSALKEKLAAEGFENIKDYFVPPIQEDDESMDLIVMDNVFEHLHYHEKATEMLEEAHRVLRPGGAIMIHCPEILSWGALFWNGDYTHNYPTSRRRLEQMFADYDFEILVNRNYSGPVHGLFAPFLGFLAKCLFWIDWLPVRKWRDQFNKLRSTFLINVFFVARPRK